MDVRMKIEQEIERKKKIIEDCKNMMERIPNHLRPSQETALEIYKRELEALEQELVKLENKNFMNK
ncbi:MAG: hypothetical protein GX201_13445 [Clostridiales bacterium]|nr:hypothetical protein [Clostridiales bacterium]